MCTSSDSGSSGFWKDAALILGASMLLNRKQDNSSEDYGSCDNPVSMIIECFGMMKLLFIDPIIWAFGVVSEAPSLLGKIFQEALHKRWVIRYNQHTTEKCDYED